MPNILVKLILFILGVSFGSFLGCLVYRLNRRLEFNLGWKQWLIDLVKGRSHCDCCKRQLLWRDNIPIISFIFLRGRCRFCHSPIQWHYPLIELGTGILTLITFNIQHSIFNLFITYVLIALFISDFQFQTLPDEIIFPAIGISFLSHFQNIDYLKNFVLSSLGATLFFWLILLLTKRKGMGMGDVKLACLMGLILGFPKIIVALFLAFLTGGLISVILIITGKKFFGEQIAFGPFLTTATWISLFWGQSIWQFYTEKVLL